MAIENINFKIKTATEEYIYSHLMECKDSFIPPLDKKVNIRDYSKKIAELSITFEAWTEGVLIGLIAAYFNDTETQLGYITNVSIIKEQKNKGITSELLENCIKYARQNNFKEIILEVHKDNTPAINLYEKFNFLNFDSKKNNRLMKLQLLNNEQ